MENPPNPSPAPPGVPAPARAGWRLAAFLGAAALGTVVFVLFVPSFGGNAPVQPGPSGTPKSEGERLYQMHCASCHGPAGDGKPTEAIPALRGRFLSVEVIERSMREGGKNMPKFIDLPPEQIEAIADYVHGL